MKRSIFNYLKGFDYLIKTGNTVDDCYPHYTVDTKGEAVDTAKDLLKILEKANAKLAMDILKIDNEIDNL